MKNSITIIAASAALLAPSIAGAHDRWIDLPESRFADTFVIQSFLDTDIAGGPFEAELARAYQDRAGYEASYTEAGDGNWYDAMAFSNKGEAALAGGRPAPWEPSSIGVDVAAADIAYKATLFRLERYADTSPLACAQMQAFYDHYVEELRETPHYITEPSVMFVKWVEFYKKCFGNNGIVSIYGYPVNVHAPTDNDRRISDEPEPNRNELTKARSVSADLGAEEEMGVLDLVNAIVIAEGHASTTASMPYNQRLSERRAAWIAELMAANGVSAARIESLGKGEEELEVETGDEVENYFNRRTELSME